MTLDYIITILRRAVEAEGISVHGQYTIGGDKTAIDWLTHCRIEEKIRLFPDLYVVWITHKGESYIAVIGYEVGELKLIPCLEDAELNAGIFAALVYELKLGIKKNAENTKIADAVFTLPPDEAAAQKENQREKIDFNNLLEFFPNVQIFSVDSAKKKEDLHQIIGELLSANDIYYILPYAEKTQKAFQAIFQEAIPYLPYDNILASYLSSDFRFAYLDLYRSIEMLQEYSFYEPLYNSYKNNGLTLTLHEFITNFRENTNLEPKLGEALKKLIGEERNNNMPAANGEALSNWLYKRRNVIAHLKMGQDTGAIKFDESEWNTVIHEMLKLITELYKEKGGLLA